jgi:DNA-binding IscR family transcriptional regulator
VDCINSRVCPIEAQCRSQHTWRDLYEEITNCVDSITLEDLAEAYHKLDQVEYVI